MSLSSIKLDSCKPSSTCTIRIYDTIESVSNHGRKYVFVSFTCRKPRKKSILV